MKLQVGDVIRVKEDLQFVTHTDSNVVGREFKVFSVCDARGDPAARVWVQDCEGYHMRMVRNPDMEWKEFTDYYEVIYTSDPEKIGYQMDVCTDDTTIDDITAEKLMAKIGNDPNSFKVQSGGVVWQNPYQPWPDSQWPWDVAESPHIPTEAPKGEGIKSDGGSSSYYDIEIPSWLVAKILERAESDEGAYIKTEELIEVVFDNDFDFGNNFKSSVRAMGKMKGAGKAGNTVGYECNKMDYSTNKIRQRDERNEGVTTHPSLP